MTAEAVSNGPRVIGGAVNFLHSLGEKLDERRSNAFYRASDIVLNHAPAIANLVAPEKREEVYLEIFKLAAEISRLG
jgi:hypothetical protein